ncbi:MAG: T9SS type A sorting domain-containing protein [Bacteroidales bacterium]|nr:T9SS type A sorting domain-containing protein [Bacteroidales bacterium]
MKLNACMEKEWCRIYTVGQNRFDKTVSVKQIPGGYIALVFYGNELSSNEKVYMYRLDNNGDLLWQQQYGNTDSMMAGAEGYDMTVTPDLKYLIGGYCYYPDSGTSGPRYLRPLIIQVDSMGNTAWELPWRYISGAHFYGMAYRSIIDNKNTIYSCGRHIDEEATPPGDRPTMLKTDSNGNELTYYDLVPDSWQAVFFNLNWFQDSTIEIDGGWGMNSMSEGQIAAFKVDKNGNVLDSINIMESVYCFSDAIIDMDNKVVLVQPLHDGNHWRTNLWKLNSDLEYDTLYTHPIVYDSLCPHPIPSDTIPLDCVVVGLNEPFENPETGRLKVYPNPASDVLHVEIPDKLKAETHSPVFNLTTVYHQWKSAVMEVYDLFGKQVFSKEINRGDKQLDLNVSAWPRGMYVVRLVYNGKTVASEKVVVE